MLRMPAFEYRRPSDLAEAVALLRGEGAGEGRAVRVVAGGTDLYPNLKRRQIEADVVVALRGIAELHGTHAEGEGMRVGGAESLAAVAAHPEMRLRFPAVCAAVESISTPVLRHMGTLGGNLLIDTRCNYLNQSEEWRCAVDSCLKDRGDTCWVAPSSPRCWAVSSCDSAPILAALGARVRLAGADGERELPVAELYRDDGIDWLTKRPDEILVDIALPASSSPLHCRSAFRKLRRRGSIDFGVLSVAVALWTDGGGVVERASIFLGGVASSPLRVPGAEAALVGAPVDDERVAEAALLCRRAATPLDNTDFAAQWRSKMVEVWAADTLDACR
jgi:4-hydroxybenzoyl-CoA reductase subunit beta